MKIAFFLEIFYPEINGVITATLDLARNLQSLGHHVLLVVPANKDSNKIRDIDGMEVFAVPSVSTFIYPGVRLSNPWSRKLYKKLEGDGIEIVHITGPWTVAWAGINHARSLGIPIVQTFHTMLNEDTYLQYVVKSKRFVPVARWISWWYFGKYLQASDVITVPSRFACDVLKKRYPEKSIFHISNGVDRSQFIHHAERKELTAVYPFYNDKTFVFVGRIGLEKSIDVLVKGFAEAVKHDPDLHLVLVGDGPSREDMEELITKLHVSTNIHLAGRILHADLLKSGILNHAKGFITASVTENQPMTVIEAICCGLPLIVADVEGMRELAQGSALFFRPGDAEHLAAQIIELAGNAAIHASLSRESRELAKGFDGRNVAKDFEVLYNDILTNFKERSVS